MPTYGKQRQRELGAPEVNEAAIIETMTRLQARAERAEAELARFRHAQEQTPWYAHGDPDSCPYRYLIDQLDASVLFIDADLIVRHANHYAADLMGVDAAELEGVSARELLVRVSPPGAEHSATVEQFLADPFARSTDEIDVLRPDGSEARFSVTRRPVLDSDGTVLGVIAIGTDVSERRQAELRVARYQQSLKSLGSEVALAEERKRRAIADRIHDEISQNLACAKLRVGSLTTCLDLDSCRDGISLINELLDAAIAGSRTLAFELSPPLLHELGFIEAVEWLAEQFEQRHDVDIAFTDDGRDKPLAQDVSVTLFRAVNELLTNVVTHADADHAHVSVSRANGNVLVCVTDNGRGFCPVKGLQDQKSYGLFNINERLDYVGGTMLIESNKLTGTSVTLTAPVETASP